MLINGEKQDHDIANDLYVVKCRRCLREYSEAGIYTTPIDHPGQILMKYVHRQELVHDADKDLIIVIALMHPPISIHSIIPFNAFKDSLKNSSRTAP